MRVPLALFLLAAFATSCLSTAVTPASDLALARAGTARPDLGFDLRFTYDPRLLHPEFHPRSADEFDGERLGAKAALLRDALVGTGAFESVSRQESSAGLHCTFEVRWTGEIALGGILCGLTLGLLPDLVSEEYEWSAFVSAPGKASRTYTARTSGRLFLWLPLLPVGLVQAATRRSDLQQGVDALVTQMAKDGWLKG